MKNQLPQLRSVFTPGFLLTTCFTVAVTISACGPGQKTKTTTVPPSATSGQKLLGTQLGEDQPVTDESMETLGRDWAERPAPPSHRRVRIKTPTKPFVDDDVEVVGPQPLPSPDALAELDPETTSLPASAESPLPTPAQAPAPLEPVSDELMPAQSPPSPPENSGVLANTNPRPQGSPTEPVKQQEPHSQDTPSVDPKKSPVVDPKPNVVQPKAQPAAVEPIAPEPAPSVPRPPVPPQNPPVQEPPAKSSTGLPAAQKEKVAPLPPNISDEENLIPMDPQLLKLDQSTRTVRARIFPHPVNETPFFASERPDEAHLSNAGGLILLNAQGRQFAQGKSAKFFFLKGVIKVGSQSFPLNHTIVVPRSEEHLTEVSDIRGVLSGKVQDARDYRGKFVIANVKDLVTKVPRWSVVNYVDVEDYVISVVRQEIGNGKDTVEAIRAQAIAARTYVVYHLLRAREGKLDYDVETTTAHQVYGGKAGEDKFVTPIVNTTEGQIIVQELAGAVKVISANFSANSGGHTCAPEECWAPYGRPTSYLLARRDVDVRAAKFSNGAKNTNGTRSGKRKASDVILVLGRMKLNKGAVLTKVKSIIVSERTPSDRVKRLTIDALASDGQSVAVHLSDSETRAFLRSMGFRQYYLDFISSDGNEIRYYSYGAGHGVGMSQDGAIVQALQGRTATQILAFYFANTRITTLGITKAQ
ncbi:MAG: SpoIID/LytB domain-containing protein [Bdellovibrionales bacterium]|nr:SpoIID/LytB domain-containing protein [Bdellovibrionales bacterium]